MAKNTAQSLPLVTFYVPIPRLAASEQALLITTPLCFNTTGLDGNGPKAGVCAWLIPQVGPLKRPADGYRTGTEGYRESKGRASDPVWGGQGPARPPELARYPSVDGSTHNAAKTSRHSAPPSAAPRKPLDYEHNGRARLLPAPAGPLPCPTPPLALLQPSSLALPVFLWHPHRRWSRGRGSGPTKQIAGPIGSLFLPKRFPQLWWPLARFVSEQSWDGLQGSRDGGELRGRIFWIPLPLPGTEQTRSFSSRPLPAQHSRVRHDADHAAWRLLPSIRPDKPAFMSCSSPRLQVRWGPPDKQTRESAVGWFGWLPQCPKGEHPDAVSCGVPCLFLVHTTPPTHPVPGPDGGR